MAEDKIISEHVQEILDYMQQLYDKTYHPNTLATLTTLEHYIKKSFPEAFKPVQEYCCTAFKRAVEAGDIWKDEERWKFCFFKTGWESFMLSCPSCGRKPKPPIKQEDS